MSTEITPVAPGAEFSLLRSKTYADEAEDQIRDLILNGYFRPGQRLNELALSELLQISRSPIREALKALVGLGLVRLVSGKGAFVTEFDPTAVRDLMEVRIALEGKAASLAAERATDSQRGQLHALLQRVEEDVAAPVDAELHGLVLECARNPVLSSHAAEVITQVQVARTRSGVRRPAESYRVHYRRIVAAILSGDSDEAADAMKEHLLASLHNMESHTES